MQTDGDADACFSFFFSLVFMPYSSPPPFTNNIYSLSYTAGRENTVKQPKHKTDFTHFIHIVLNTVLSLVHVCVGYP